MHFLPAESERYRSAIRNYLQNRLLKSGINQKTLSQIRLLRISEVVHRRHQKIPTSLEIFIDAVLHSVSLKLMRYGKQLSFNIIGNGNFELDRDLLELIILQIINLSYAKENIKITAQIQENTLGIMSDIFEEPILKKLVNKVGGVWLIVCKENKALILLPIKKSAQQTAPIFNEWEHLLNPLSNLNLFLDNF